MHETKRRRHTLLLSLCSVFVVAAFLAVSGLSLFLYREGNGLDLTAEGIYTLSPAMQKALAGVEEEVTITFFSDPDRLYASDDLRPVYVTAKQLSAVKKNITVETHDLEADPSAADPFKETPASVVSSDYVAVSYGKKFRTADADAFYSVENNARVGYVGEMRLATMILSVVRVSAPVAYFTVGHGERYYDENDQSHPDNEQLSALRGLLLDVGLSIATLDLDTESAVPEDCVLLIMNGPTSDYGDNAAATLGTQSATEKLDRYLHKNGSMLYFRDPDVPTSELPILSEFFDEWGITLTDGVVRSTAEEGDRGLLSATYADAESSPIAHSIYESIAGLTAPPRTVFTDATALSVKSRVGGEEMLAPYLSRTAVPFLFSGEDTRLYDENGDLLSDSGSYPLAVLALTAYTDGDYNTHNAYLAVFGTTGILSNTYLGENAYGNRDILTAAIRVLTRTDEYVSSDVGTTTNPNSPMYGGKVYMSDAAVTAITYHYIAEDGRSVFLTARPAEGSGYTYVGTLYPLSASGAVLWTVLLALFPLSALGAMTVVLLRRRHL